MIMRLLLTVTDLSGIARGVFQGFRNPPLGCSTSYNFKRNEILTVKENEKKKNKKHHNISGVTCIEV